MKVLHIPSDVSTRKSLIKKKNESSVRSIVLIDSLNDSIRIPIVQHDQSFNLVEKIVHILKVTKKICVMNF